MKVLRESHGSIIHALIRQKDLVIDDEEQLWITLLEWSTLAVRRPELLGPFAEAPAALETCTKRARQDTELEAGFGSNEAAQRENIGRMISKHMRFAAMSKEFFYDNVRTWLTREDSDAVMSCLCLGRKSPEVCQPEREGMFHVISGGEGTLAEAVEIDTVYKHVAEKNVKFSTWKSWKPVDYSSGLTMTVSMPQDTKVPDMVIVQLNFSSVGSMWPWRLTFLQTSAVAHTIGDKCEPVSFRSGPSLYFELSLMNLKPPLLLGIFPHLQQMTSTQEPAGLLSVTIFAPNTRLHADRGGELPVFEHFWTRCLSVTSLCSGNLCESWQKICARQACLTCLAISLRVAQPSDCGYQNNYPPINQLHR